MLLEGMFLPLTTPFTPDGRLNSSKLKDNVTRYSKTPAAGLVALSRTGQPMLLSDAETREMMLAVAETAAAEKVLLVGVARDSVRGTLELIEYAAEIGYDAVLVPVPAMLRDGRAAKEVLSCFRAVADSAALPVVLDGGNGEIAVEAAMQLAEHPKVIGMVDAGWDAAKVAELVRGTRAVRREVTVTTVFAAVTRRMAGKQQASEAMFISAGTLSGGGTALSVAPAPIRTRVKIIGFQVLSGRTAAMLEALEAGATGAMPPLAASAPQVCYEVLAAWKDGDPALAAEKQERLRMLTQRIEVDMDVSGLVSGIKYGCDLNGYFGGRPRLPMLPLTGAERGEIERLMQGIRN